ncbi:MAG: hypothetical protein ACE5J6_03335, partial [Candidatus Bathyarchaeia archaeon]
MASVVFNLKKTTLPLLLLTFALLFSTVLASSHANAVTTFSPSTDIQVDQISHKVQIQDGGLVVINDALKLSPREGVTSVLLQNFSMGFSFKYGFNLDYCFAYDASNPNVLLGVELDVGLGWRIGFYGVNVIFPESGVSISNGGSYNLTVVFVFSNLISSETETETIFNVTFPMYPSLTQNASRCDVTVTLPHNTNYTDSAFEKKELGFDITTVGSSQILNHTKRPLDSFQYEPAWLEFNATDSFPIFEANEVKREIRLDQWGGVHLSDFYHITNKGLSIDSVTISLPLGASFDPETGARDELGSFPEKPLVQEGNMTTPTNVTVQLRDALAKDEEVKFTVTYSLPWENYVNQYNWRDYNLTFPLFEHFNWTIRKLSVTVLLPEGAEFQSSKPVNPYNVEKSVFQETVTFSFFNVTPFHDLDFDLTYRYLIFWASFRPTLWMGVLVIVVCAIIFLWRAPKPPPVPITPVPLEDLKSFVDAYEEKARILLELESMEQRLRKGRIPRRRYKVRKKMLDGRLFSLSRDLTALQGKIRAAGPRYADIMRQIEVAETMLEGAKADTRKIEARYRRGEISKGAYRRLL